MGRHLCLLVLLLTGCGVNVQFPQPTSVTVSPAGGVPSAAVPALEPAVKLPPVPEAARKRLQQASGQVPTPFAARAEGGDEGPSAGVWVEVPDTKSDRLVQDLAQEMPALGCQVFLAERNYGSAMKERGLDARPDRVAVIASKDQFDILRVRRTDGANYDIPNAAVLAKVEEWHKRHPLRITGADIDWMEARFEKTPSDPELEKIAQEIYAFCPDVVDQGTGSVEGLKAEMKRTGVLFLWWD